MSYILKRDILRSYFLPLSTCHTGFTDANDISIQMGMFPKYTHEISTRAREALL